MPEENRSKNKSAWRHVDKLSATLAEMSLSLARLEHQMSNQIVNISITNLAIERLRNIWATLRSPKFLSALRHVTETEAAELRRSLLRIIAFLDDSVSNPHLGSIFDRTSKDPLNEMLANIAMAYGVAATVAGTTGTTGLNAPAVMTLASETGLIPSITTAPLIRAPRTSLTSMLWTSLSVTSK